MISGVTKNQPLIFFAIVPVPESIINKVAARFADGNGNWQWDGFSHLRPNNILFRIALFQPPMHNKGGDQVYWAKSNKGIFTVKSAYNVISNTQNRDEDKSWDIVWLWKGPKSIRTFLWLVMHNRLKTKAELLRRHIPTDNGCDRCGYSVKNTLHVIRDCMIVKWMWNRFIPVDTRPMFFSLNIKDWLWHNLNNKRLLGCELKWDTFFGVAIWRLWFGVISFSLEMFLLIA